MTQVTEEEKKLYEAAKAEGLHVYTPEAFYYYYHGQNAPAGHPYTGLSYAEYIERVRAEQAVRTLSAARLQRWQGEGCAVELPYEAVLRERTEQIVAERGIPYDLARVEAYRQLESEGLFRTLPGGAVEVRPYVELRTQGGHKIVPVPESVTEQDFAKWVYEQMKQHGAEIAWVGSQRVSFEQLKNIFEPPPQQTQPQPEQKYYIEVMRGYGPSEKMEIMPFEEFKKQYPQYGEREYMLYLFKTAREKGYEQILTQQGWIKIPEKFEVTGMEIFTPEGIKMVPPKVFSETVESSLKSTTVGTENLAAAALKGFGVGLLRGISIGAAERIVPSIAAKPPVTLQSLAPPTQPARSTAVDFSLQAETPEQKRAREAYFMHEIAAIPGQIVGSLMLSKAIETVAKLPPAEEIAKKYAAGEKITPLERVKLELWLHTPEKVWKGLQKVGDVVTVRETKYQIPKEVEANIMQLSQPQERLTYFATKIRSWQEISPELAQHLQKMSEPFGYIPVDIGGRTAKIPWHEPGVTALAAGRERYIMMGLEGKAFGIGIYPTQTLTEPGIAITKLSGIVNVKTVESLTLGGTPKLLTEFAKTTTSFAPTFTAPSIPVKTTVHVHAAPIPALLPPEPKPVIEPKKEESVKPEVKIEIKPEEVQKIPVRIEEERKEVEKPRPFTLMRIPFKPEEREITSPISIPFIRTETREAIEVAPATLAAPKVAPAVTTAVTTVAKTAQLQRTEPTQPSPVKPVPTPAPPSPRIPIPPLRSPPTAPIIQRGEARGAKYWRVDWFEQPIPQLRIALPVPQKRKKGGKRKR